MSYTIEQLDAAVASAVAECMEARRMLLVTLDEMRAEENASYELVARQGDLLTGVVNALRGEPPPDTLWSHHDAAELAQKTVRRVTQLEDLLRRVHVRMGRALLGLSVAVRSTEGASGEEEVIDPIMEEITDTLAPAEFNVACACGHAPEEHGHDPQYPGSPPRTR